MKNVTLPNGARAWNIRVVGLLHFLSRQTLHQKLHHRGTEKKQMIYFKLLLPLHWEAVLLLEVLLPW